MDRGRYHLKRRYPGILIHAGLTGLDHLAFP